VGKKCGIRWFLDEIASVVSLHHNDRKRKKWDRHLTERGKSGTGTFLKSKK